eukprot:3869234-Rhodomonas_salina.2
MLSSPSMISCDTAPTTSSSWLRKFDTLLAALTITTDPGIDPLLGASDIRLGEMNCGGLLCSAEERARGVWHRNCVKTLYHHQDIGTARHQHNTVRNEKHDVHAHTQAAPTSWSSIPSGRPGRRGGGTGTPLSPGGLLGVIHAGATWSPAALADANGGKTLGPRALCDPDLAGGARFDIHQEPAAATFSYLHLLDGAAQ